jgi:predicted transposase YbfD/YdcC
VRHGITAVLAVAVCAVLAGARSFAAIGEWATDASEQLLSALGAGASPPSESTIRRCLQRLNGEKLDTTIGSWASEATAADATTRRAIAVDGKRLCGSGSDTAAPRHLLGAIDHDRGVVLAQREVGEKSNEIPEFAPLLDALDLSGAVVTGDALHAQRAHADYLVLQRGADYVLTVKGNQPSLYHQLQDLPWAQVPVAHTSSERGHGRVEQRGIKVVSVDTGILFPHARQALQITRTTRRKDGSESSTEIAYAVTSLPVEQATAAELACWVRGHWTVENRLHWVRDVTLGEDLSQTRTGSGPRVMASLRNLAISMLRLDGATNIAQALRHHARDPLRPVKLLLTC